MVDGSSCQFSKNHKLMIYWLKLALHAIRNISKLHVEGAQVESAKESVVLTSIEGFS